jgi:ABC-type polysaccharide/polyol phosphate transport system ATPase subunit
VSATVSVGQSPSLEPRRAPAPAISLQEVNKSFSLPHERYHTLKERALHVFRNRQVDVLHAVRDVTLDIASGEFFGIVGRNGSGKSTLLKCIAGIYGIDSGDIAVNGRLSPFIELGVGFNPDLTARDNVIINAVMLGLSRKEARERFDDVIAFAGLEEFIDLKLKNYSSGMYVRLAFATAVQVDAEILLIDEVLAVGDAAFQRKCFEELTRLQHAGHTMVFVTHDMGTVERFCDRAMLLERGEVVDIGDPASIARQYNHHNYRRWREEGGTPEDELPPVDPPATIINAGFESLTGETAITSLQGEPCVVHMRVHFREAIDQPAFTITLLDESHRPVFTTNTETQRIETASFDAGAEASIRMRFDNFLAPGRYLLVASVARPGFGGEVLHAHMTNSIIVTADKPGGGITDLPHTLEIARDPAVEAQPPLRRESR